MRRSICVMLRNWYGCEDCKCVISLSRAPTNRFGEIAHTGASALFEKANCAWRAGRKRFVEVDNRDLFVASHWQSRRAKWGPKSPSRRPPVRSMTVCIFRQRRMCHWRRMPCGKGSLFNLHGYAKRPLCGAVSGSILHFTLVMALAMR